jgi:antitoxin MazE
MKANIVQIGNLQGIRIPKILLDQLKFEKTVELEVLPEGLLMRPVSKPPHADWNEKFAAALAESGDEAQEFTDWNERSLTVFDEEEW